MSELYCIGQDLSHHNTVEQILNGTDFVWLKASEGKTYQDDKMTDFVKHIAEWRADNLPIMGFYHYARFDNGNSAADEAHNMLKTVKPHLGRCLLALDFEGLSLVSKTIPERGKWISDFLNIVHLETSVIPFIYGGYQLYAELKQYGESLTDYYPYWIAHYNVAYPRGYKGNNYKMWQFTSKPFDLDIAFMPRAELATYALPGYH